MSDPPKRVDGGKVCLRSVEQYADVQVESVEELVAKLKEAGVL